MRGRKFKARQLALMATFLAYILVIGVIERRFPLDIVLPGIKLGLSNVVVLIALYVFSPAEVFALVLLKCVMTSFFAGSFVSFLYSICGSVFSFLVMLCLTKLSGAKFSPIGISVAGAVSHNIGQITAASFVTKTMLIFTYLPVLLFSGTVTGILVGVMVKYTLKPIQKFLIQK